ncbi:MAG: ABC transporter permease [Lachnospiraceae bacterium]|nr:ABC transporter permease [Lachnospiraceae bacterium]
MSWNDATTQMIITGVYETILITVLSTFFGYLFGLPYGIAMVVTDRDGLHPMPAVYKVLDILSNILRSVPFLILMILLIPFTRAVVGKSYGTEGTIVPLVISAIPYIARLVESSLKEVDPGVIEAAQAMGSSKRSIVLHVLLVEARTSLVVNATIATATILGYSAMAGSIGGGGLGAIAIQYGYYRYETTIMVVTVVLLILLVQLFQTIGMKAAKALDKRK